jgi:hypothetical protein
MSEGNVTVTLNLKPEVEAGLLAQAQASGMTLEEYVLSMVEGAALQESTASEGGVTIEDGLPVYRSSSPLPKRIIEEAIERSRDERSQHILGDRT